MRGGGGRHGPGGLPEGGALEGQTVGSTNFQGHRPALGHTMPEARGGQGADQTSQRNPGADCIALGCGTTSVHPFPHWDTE